MTARAQQEVDDAYQIFAATGDGVGLVEALQRQVFADTPGRDPMRIHRLAGRIVIPAVVFEDSPELKRLLELHGAPMHYDILQDVWVM